jgi:hypothetical protein
LSIKLATRQMSISGIMPEKAIRLTFIDG